MASPSSFFRANKGYCIVLLTAIALSAILQLFVPYLDELGYAVYAHRIWFREIDCSAIFTPTSLGYAGYISPFVAGLGEVRGTKFANFVALVALLMFAVCWIKYTRRSLSRSVDIDNTVLISMVLVSAICFHPYIILNLGRATEAILMAAILIAFLFATSQPVRFWSAFLVGLCFGIGVYVRLNALSLVVPATAWFFFQKPKFDMRLRWISGMSGIVAAAAVYIAASFLTAGCPFFTPKDGGYTLYAGTNEFSLQSLVKYQDAEPSLPEALQKNGIYAPPHNVPQRTYIALAKKFALTCPFCIVKLAIVKFGVFFSPRLMHVKNLFYLVVQIIITIPALIALTVATWRFFRNRIYSDGIVLLIYLSYAAPFIMTDANPRHRFPLDILALCYLASLIHVRLPWWHRGGHGFDPARRKPVNKTAL